MHRHSLLTFLLIPFIPTAEAQNTTVDAKIKSTFYSGSGCSPGTVSASLLRNSALVLAFDNMYAQIGPNVPAAMKNRNCVVNVNITRPGFEMRVNGEVGGEVDGTWVQGNMGLEGGVNAVFKTVYDFVGATDSQSSTSNTTIKGPRTGPFLEKLENWTEIRNGIVSPCGGGMLRINDQMRLTSTNSTISGSIGPSEDTVTFVQEVGLSWKAC
ncbi:hypothetical protein BCR34DRAFT_600867 [Clohesyomyces aquaticus]|uniref:Secreted protein n=1 Tax=Clohesyomyces aquaticus TaxID=1231657 RepID=A0A1Y1ZQN3_9PLEO|nr:hypothetical protein BCR34DRAFT_600867 [Clohesyomyces aquaticus]